MTVSRYESVLVYEGDSVWSIAKDHLKNADEEQLTSYVEEIKEINNISQEGMIYAGRYLILPIYEKMKLFNKCIITPCHNCAKKTCYN